uniref:IPT/TIG domain-containing protein n=1 Tax=Tetraselmis chuii TaxID=63592 RepID=A0A7S1SVA9_9CHLO
MNVWMMVGGQQSGLIRVYSYQPPRLLAINPSTVEPGMFVTLSGENLGSEPSLIAVDVYDRLGRLLFGAPTQNLTLSTPHSQMLFPVPYGAGVQRSFVVKLPAPVGVAVPPRNVQSSGSDPESELFFSYVAPVITDVSPAPTAGGTVTITGSGFGSARDDRLSVQTVLLGSDVCTNANVTVDGVEFICEMPPGSGGGYDAFVTVDGQDSEFTFGAFSYASPRVDTVSPELASGGSTVTLAGDNFGIDTRAIGVRLGGELCSEVVLLELHTLMTCRVPLGVSGRDVAVVVTVNGVANNATAAPTFTYSYLGCTNPIAENYNSAATEDDGTCIIAGCTDEGAANYNPIANLADDSCIREDGIIRLRFDLDFAVYLTNTSRYNTTVLEYVANNLGLPIGTPRLEVRNAEPGSTIFYIAILDDPEATGARNDELAAQLQRLVVANEWAHDKVELGSLLEVIMPDGSRIITKDSEPRVSVGSIVGIVIGGVILVLWAVFWRRILRWCAGKCGSGGDEKDDLVEAAIYNNSLYKQTATTSSSGVGGTRMPASLQSPTTVPYGGRQIVPYGGGQYVQLNKDSQ